MSDNDPVQQLADYILDLHRRLRALEEMLWEQRLALTNTPPKPLDLPTPTEPGEVATLIAVLNTLTSECTRDGGPHAPHESGGTETPRHS